MKPLILTMEAFGTFAQKTEIDFSKLSKDGIFLVSANIYYIFLIPAILK